MIGSNISKYCVFADWALPEMGSSQPFLCRLWQPKSSDLCRDMCTNSSKDCVFRT
uniref:Uncharacterized protein n=1 Tax=Rhizophora mucronata TaxID=61149 RepID=A0A2P2QMK6_RHIMU